jgi:hypothetical protein
VKGDNSTAKEIRDVIDAIGEGRYVVAEHTTLSSVEFDWAERQLARILRFALRCRVEADRVVMVSDHNAKSVMQSDSETAAPDASENES